eukprot:gene9853-10899_t
MGSGPTGCAEICLRIIIEIVTLAGQEKVSTSSRLCDCDVIVFSSLLSNYCTQPPRVLPESVMNNGSASSSQAQPSPGIATRRRTGFDFPWDPLQVVTWLLFPLIVSHYFAFLFFMLWDDISKIVISVIYGVCALALAVSVCLTCFIDPADNALCGYAHREGQEEIFCYFCEVNVHASSKHCRFCDKCVLRFDHHCKWLNTCIGKKNYAWFLVVIVAALLLTSINLGVSIAITIDAFISPHAILHRTNHVNDAPSHLQSAFSIEFIKAMALISSVIFAAVVAMILQLVSFHIMLICKGSTTYDYIVLQQKKARDREAHRLQKEVELAAQIRRQDQALTQAANVAAIHNSNSSRRESNSSRGRDAEFERRDIDSAAMEAGTTEAVVLTTGDCPAACIVDLHEQGADGQTSHNGSALALV